MDGELGKREGMARVKRAADPVWSFCALLSVFHAARENKWFTVDEVHAGIPDWAKTHELRALGPIMLDAAKRGWIMKSSILPVNTERGSRHAAPVTVWRSLIYRYRGPRLRIAPASILPRLSHDTALRLE
jgi:hypothetical protein